ncbi:MAG TPA: hypothetical protein DDW16_04180 [Clostridiales bacterium]|nr:hypothetical protein [Clostridiales bacterium]
MKIVKCTFHNYRNLDGVTLCFDEICNFFVGENNIGKTNALHALNVIFSGKDFSNEDFHDITLPLKIEYTVKTKDKIENINSIYKEFYLIKNYGEKKRIYSYSGNKISSTGMKCVFVDMMSNKEYKLIFTPWQKNIINKILNNLKIVKRAKKHTGDNSFIDFIGKDEKALKTQSYPYFFVKKILFKLLGNLERGEKEKSVIMLFDQPEINLHPFAQKTLISDLLNIVLKKDEEFNRLIDELFGIKKLELQLFLVSHSDRILSERYENIIRFYRVKGQVKAISGNTIKLKRDNKVSIAKQLIMQFPYFSLAIFSKAVILVEGVSEFGAITEFAKTLDIDTDYLGISIISANGEGNISAFSTLLESFGIKVFAIKDRDVFCENEKGIIYTDFVDFEDEIVRSADLGTLQKICYLLGFDFKDVTSLPLEKKNERYRYYSGKRKNPFTEREINDTAVKKLACVSVLTSKKSVITGKIIGRCLKKDQIPQVYKNVLLSAKEYADKN